MEFTDLPYIGDYNSIYNRIVNGDRHLTNSKVPEEVVVKTRSLTTMSSHIVDEPKTMDTFEYERNHSIFCIINDDLFKSFILNNKRTVTPNCYILVKDTSLILFIKSADNNPAVIYTLYTSEQITIHEEGGCYCLPIIKLINMVEFNNFDNYCLALLRSSSDSYKYSYHVQSAGLSVTSVSADGIDLKNVDYINKLFTPIITSINKHANNTYYTIANFYDERLVLLFQQINNKQNTIANNTCIHTKEVDGEQQLIVSKNNVLSSIVCETVFVNRSNCIIWNISNEWKGSFMKVTTFSRNVKRINNNIYCAVAYIECSNVYVYIRIHTYSKFDIRSGTTLKELLSNSTHHLELYRLF